jgi:hypothetical protein
MDAESPPRKKRIFADAFADAGPLTKKYKPFILRQAKKFSQRYRLRFATVRDRAIEIAEDVEPKFDPARGKAFPSFLEPWLWGGLTRFCKREYRLINGIMSLRQKDALARAGHPGFELHDRQEREDWEKLRGEYKSLGLIDLGEYRKEGEPRTVDEKRQAERERMVGWGNRRPDEMMRFGFEITDYRYGKAPNGDGGNYRKWKANVGSFGSNSVARLDEAAEVIRPRLKTQKQLAMLDWLVGNLAGRDSRTIIQAAADAGITKGYASKIVASLAGRLDGCLTCDR